MFLGVHIRVMRDRGQAGGFGGLRITGEILHQKGIILLTNILFQSFEYSNSHSIVEETTLLKHVQLQTETG